MTVVITCANPALVDEIARQATSVGISVVVVAPGDCSRIAKPGDLIVCEPEQWDELRADIHGDSAIIVTAHTDDVEQVRAREVAGAFVLPQQIPEFVAFLAANHTGTQNSRRAQVIGVVGACGGAGASVLAAALARECGPHSCLVDVDECGGGIDLLLGLEEEPGARWFDVADLASRPGGGLGESLLQWHGTAVLSWGREPNHRQASTASIVAAIDALVAERRCLILDLAHSLAFEPGCLTRLDDLVLVVPRRLRAVAAAQSVLRRIDALLPDSLMPRRPRFRLATRGPSRLELRPDEISEILGIDVEVDIGHDRQLDEWLERGFGLPESTRGPLRAGARELARRIGLLPVAS